MSTRPQLPDDLPRFFLDRNMGSIAVPRGLRALGLEVVTLSERYGVHAGERIEDVRWMPEAAAAGEAVLMADDAIRRKNPEERRVLIDCGLRAFVVNAQLPASTTIERFTRNLSSIGRACAREGPFVYRIHPERIERLRLTPPESSSGTRRR